MRTFDRAAVARALSEVLARHPIRHDEWRLGWEIDRALEPLAPWLMRNNGWPRRVSIERPWLALDPAAERERVARGTAALLAAMDALQAIEGETARAFSSAPRPTLTDPASITASILAVIAALPRLETDDDYEPTFAAYLRALGIDPAIAGGVIAEVFEDQQDAIWPPLGGVEAWALRFGQIVAAHLG